MAPSRLDTQEQRDKMYQMNGISAFGDQTEP